MDKGSAIYLLMGPSGSGKDTLASILAMTCGYSILRSYTTRPRRYADENTHHFVRSLAEWSRMCPCDPIVAYTKFDQWEYWATAKQVDESDFYIIDPAGVEFFRQHYRGHKKIVVIMIKVPALKRLWRMIVRGDSIPSAMRRLIHDAKAFKNAEELADAIVANNDIEEACHSLQEVMKSEVGK